LRHISSEKRGFDEVASFLLATAIALAVPALPVTAANAGTVAGQGSWATPSGGRSTCANVGTTGIACSHGYSSHDSVTGTETCSDSLTIGSAPSVTVVNPCHAALTGFTSGTGRAIGEGAGACVTTGVLTGTLTFGDSTGASYPPVTVSIVNVLGSAQFFGDFVNASGAVVAHAEGTFTMACGGIEIGSFAGSYTLL
jgi:hypothetical protein